MFVVLTFNFIIREHSRQSTFRRRDKWCHFGTINTQTLYIYYTIFSLYRSEFDPQQQHPSTGTTSKVGSAGRPLIVFVLHLATFRLVLLDAHTRCHIGSGSLTSSSDITWRRWQQEWRMGGTLDHLHNALCHLWWWARAPKFRRRSFSI